MGNDKQEQRAKSILPRGGGHGTDERVTWMDADASILREFITKVADLGGASRFGYTRDGGTYSIGIYLGDERATYYFRRDQDIDTGIRDLLSDLEDIPLDQIPTDRKARKR